MFARILEMTTKKGQARALCTAIEQKGFPIVGKYPGFLDGMCLISEEKPDFVLGISLWQNREAAEKYRVESYSTIAEIYQPFLEGGIHVRAYEVPFAFSHKVKKQAARAS